MPKILVTGADGQLGSCIRKISPLHPHLKFIFTTRKDFNITDKKGMQDFLKREKNFDYCINCAAATNVDLLEAHPGLAYLVNAEGVKHLSNLCLSYEVTLIHISTDYVFDGNKREPYHTNDPTNPINCYGASKLKGEKYVQHILTSYFLIRSSWIYSEFGKNFYTTILKNIQEGKALKVINDQTGCPTNAEDLAHSIIDLIDSKSRNYGLHHFRGNKQMTWFDFAKHIAEKNKIQATIHPVNSEYYKTLAKRPKYSVLKQTL